MQYFPSKKHLSDTDIIMKSVSLQYASSISIEEFKSNPRFLHCHPDILEVIFCRSGSCKIVIDGIPYNATEGDIVIYNQNSYHQENTSDSIDFSLYCFAIKGISVPGLEPNCLTASSGPHIVHTGNSRDIFDHMFKRIYDLTRHDGNRQHSLLEYYTKTVLYEILLLCTDKTDAPVIPVNADSEVIHKIYDYLKKNYRNELRLGDIADSLHLSADYISHSFKKSTGYAPMQYVNALRIGASQVLLIETDKKVSEIALEVGFNNIGNYNRAFHLFTGTTPLAFRKNVFVNHNTEDNQL